MKSRLKKKKKICMNIFRPDKRKTFSCPISVHMKSAQY